MVFCAWFTGADHDNLCLGIFKARALNDGEVDFGREVNERGAFSDVAMPNSSVGME